MTDTTTLHAQLCAYVDSLDGASQEQRLRRAGANLGVSKVTVYRWMYGQRRIPKTVGLLLSHIAPRSVFGNAECFCAECGCSLTEMETDRCAECVTYLTTTADASSRP